MKCRLLPFSTISSNVHCVLAFTLLYPPCLSPFSFLSRSFSPPTVGCKVIHVAQIYISLPSSDCLLCAVNYQEEVNARAALLFHLTDKFITACEPRWHRYWGLCTAFGVFGNVQAEVEVGDVFLHAVGGGRREERGVLVQVRKNRLSLPPPPPPPRHSSLTTCHQDSFFPSSPSLVSPVRQ